MRAHLEASLDAAGSVAVGRLGAHPHPRVAVEPKPVVTPAAEAMVATEGGVAASLQEIAERPLLCAPAQLQLVAAPSVAPAGGAEVGPRHIRARVLPGGEAAALDLHLRGRLAGAATRGYA